MGKDCPQLCQICFLKRATRFLTTSKIYNYLHKKGLCQLNKVLIIINLKPNPYLEVSQMPKFAETCNILSINEFVVDNVQKTLPEYTNKSSSTALKALRCGSQFSGISYTF